MGDMMAQRPYEHRGSEVSTAKEGCGGLGPALGQPRRT
jgi:hypothetical protein